MTLKEKKLAIDLSAGIINAYEIDLELEPKYRKHTCVSCYEKAKALREALQKKP